MLFLCCFCVARFSEQIRLGLPSVANAISRAHGMTLVQVSLNIHIRVKLKRILIYIFLLSVCTVGLVRLGNWKKVENVCAAEAVHPLQCVQ